MDYISREDAIKHLENKIERNRADKHGHQGEYSPWVVYGIQSAINIIDGIPSADVEERNALQHAQSVSQHAQCVESVESVEERKTGKWLPIIDADEYGEPYQSGVYCSECGEMLWYVPHYCPNCGAKMEGIK